MQRAQYADIIIKQLTIIECNETANDGDDKHVEKQLAVRLSVEQKTNEKKQPSSYTHQMADAYETATINNAASPAAITLMIVMCNLDLSLVNDYSEFYGGAHVSTHKSGTSRHSNFRSPHTESFAEKL